MGCIVAIVVTTKMEGFFWQLCTGCLPTKDVLLEKTVKCDGRFPLCEDLTYIFFLSVGLLGKCGMCWGCR